ncbi:unnamed protein product, partial [Mesorhabditis belari]|uniref:Uncharacterized protein n=1 Tax=Mesorhabditis belari TaxID=2138241 RepID=A0AAF3FR86_9BILA
MTVLNSSYPFTECLLDVHWIACAFVPIGVLLIASLALLTCKKSKNKANFKYLCRKNEAVSSQSQKQHKTPTNNTIKSKSQYRKVNRMAPTAPPMIMTTHRVEKSERVSVHAQATEDNMTEARSKKPTKPRKKKHSTGSLDQFDVTQQEKTIDMERGGHVSHHPLRPSLTQTSPDKITPTPNKGPTPNKAPTPNKITKNTLTSEESINDRRAESFSREGIEKRMIFWKV